jgi:hypothetical protein
MRHELENAVGLRNVSPSAVNPLVAEPNFGGLPIRSSAMFPVDLDCRTCGATGEGYKSTYCKKCNGVGKLTVEGMASQPGGLPMMITNKKTGPKKFMPYFPTGLVPPMPMRGLV